MVKKLQKPRPDRKLNMRETKLIKALADGVLPTQAMRDAGYSDATARGRAGEKIGEARIQASIQELMEARGLTKDKLLSKLDEGLDAKRDETMPDYQARHKYLDTALKLGSHYPTDKVEHSGIIELKGIEVKIVD